jgi:ATP-dependent DNA helicase RecG
VFELLFPLGEDYLYNFLSHPKQMGVVLQVVVRKTKGIVKAHDGIPYLVGAHKTYL